MSNAAERLCSLVIETAETKPVDQKILIYRDCAEILAREPDALRLRKLAREMEVSASNCRQLVLDFKRRAEG